MAGMSSATEIPVFTLLLDTFILKKNIDRFWDCSDNETNLIKK